MSSIYGNQILAAKLGKKKPQLATYTETEGKLHSLASCRIHVKLTGNFEKAQALIIVQEEGKVNDQFLPTSFFVFIIVGRMIPILYDSLSEVPVDMPCSNLSYHATFCTLITSQPHISYASWLVLRLLFTVQLHLFLFVSSALNDVY